VGVNTLDSAYCGGILLERDEGVNCSH
ncbi:unnamed protein product, partial [Allacma fusca]